MTPEERAFWLAIYRLVMSLASIIKKHKLESQKVTPKTNGVDIAIRE